MFRFIVSVLAVGAFALMPSHAFGKESLEQELYHSLLAEFSLNGSVSYELLAHPKEQLHDCAIAFSFFSSFQVAVFEKTEDIDAAAVAIANQKISTFFLIAFLGKSDTSFDTGLPTTFQRRLLKASSNSPTIYGDILQAKIKQCGFLLEEAQSSIGKRTVESKQ